MPLKQSPLPRQCLSGQHPRTPLFRASVVASLTRKCYVIAMGSGQILEAVKSLKSCSK